MTFALEEKNGPVSPGDWIVIVRDRYQVREDMNGSLVQIRRSYTNLLIFTKNEYHFDLGYYEYAKVKNQKLLKLVGEI